MCVHKPKEAYKILDNQNLIIKLILEDTCNAQGESHNEVVVQHPNALHFSSYI